jgi:ketosteroid isomerase-like protein
MMTRYYSVALAALSVVKLQSIHSERNMTATAPTTTLSIAQQLVSLCRAGRNMDAINQLYSPQIESIEAVGTPEYPAVLNGIDAIREKNQRWAEDNTVHSAEAHGPFVGEDQFAVHYAFDLTAKATGQRMQMEEMALYTVKDGQIVREQFFYNVPGA